jgi:5-methylcytosine-specific restriction endonuclease McrA
MNDALRAAVFARDKAICSFSGLSVWYLDHGTAPFSHADWVDHVKPKSRGGKDTLENLVCAYFSTTARSSTMDRTANIFSARAHRPKFSTLRTESFRPSKPRC